MRTESDNPRAKLLAREDVQKFVRFVAFYSETNQRFDAENFSDIIPEKTLEDLRQLNRAHTDEALRALIQRCLAIVSDWQELFPAPETADLENSLFTMLKKPSNDACYRWFGLGDFSTANSSPANT